MEGSPPAFSVHGILQIRESTVWIGLSFPSPENLLDLGIKPGFLHHKQILYHLNYREDLYCPARGTLLNALW